METFVWKKSYITGIAQIDREHHHILEQIEAMYAAVKSGAKSDTIAQICRELVHSTELHFSNEEKYMERVNYQYIEEHRHEHHRLMEEARQFLWRIEQNIPGSNTGIFHILRELFLEHIIGDDKQFGAMYAATMDVMLE